MILREAAMWGSRFSFRVKINKVKASTETSEACVGCYSKSGSLFLRVAGFLLASLESIQQGLRFLWMVVKSISQCLGFLERIRFPSDSTVNTNKQRCPMVSKWCRSLFIHMHQLGVWTISHKVIACLGRIAGCRVAVHARARIGLSLLRSLGGRGDGSRVARGAVLPGGHLAFDHKGTSHTLTHGQVGSELCLGKCVPCEQCPAAAEVHSNPPKAMYGFYMLPLQYKS